MRKDVLFRGCTRPPMFLGVPYVPFFIGAGACLLLAMYMKPFYLYLLLLPVVIFVLRQMARRDEMIFHLLGLRWWFRLKTRNHRLHARMWVYSPNDYRNTPAGRSLR